MIEAKDISFGYGRRKVLSGVSAKFEDGVFAAVLGANGAGKSTLLKILSGWLKPDGGEVLYAGANAASLGARELAKSRAVLEQECRLDFACPVGQIVRMSGFSAGALGAEAKRKRRKPPSTPPGFRDFQTESTRSYPAAKSAGCTLRAPCASSEKIRRGKPCCSTSPPRRSTPPPRTRR